MPNNFDPIPVFRMITSKLIDAIQSQDWEKVKKLKTELERISE